MSTSLPTMIRLRAIQNKVRELVNGLDEAGYRHQFHPDLSALGWHLGHCVYIENYWLREKLDNDDELTRNMDKLYIPEKSPKPERGGKLPEIREMIKTAQIQQDNNALLLLEMIPPYSTQPMFENEYMQYFIIQHYAQHYETMQMILDQRAIHSDHKKHNVKNILSSTAPVYGVKHVESGQYKVGGINALSYDNELPQHDVKLNNFSIAEHPVNNAEYLGFIEAKGYQSKQFWDEDGWNWLQETQIDCPEHWFQDNNDNWYGVDQNGPYDLPHEQPVHGINYYEARAFARYAGARLPHEHEWETALNQKQIETSNQVWEWCDNPFYPYPGFKAFPYDGYSTPWFKEPHYVLKGGSRYTRPEIKRSAFRNFFNPEKRHIIAGCRLVFD